MAHPVVVLAGVKRSALRASEHYLLALQGRSVVPEAHWLAPELLDLLARLKRVNTAKKPKLETMDEILFVVEWVLSNVLADQLLPVAEDRHLRAAMLELGQVSSAWPAHVVPEVLQVS